VTVSYCRSTGVASAVCVSLRVCVCDAADLTVPTCVQRDLPRFEYCDWTSLC
jgi:hypothetical protein